MSVRNDDNVQKLIEQIKTDAVDKAKEMSEKIIADAKAEAKSIIDKANQEAEKTKEEAQNKSSVILHNGELELKGIARDVVAGLQDRILTLFKNSFGEISKELLKSDNYLGEFFLIAKQEFAGTKMELQGPEAMINFVKTKITDKDVTLTINNDSQTAFIIKANGKEFSFTEEEVMSVVLEYCTPKLGELLTNKEG